MKRSTLVPAAALALAVGSAYAQSGDMPNFNQMDKNNDGALTREEAAGNPKLQEQFDQVDSNKDGQLSRAESLAIMGRQDLYNLRESIAEFLNPEGKPPLAAESGSSGQSQQSAQGEQQNVPAPMSAELVRSVQQSLESKGVNPGPVDGVWGPRTHQALREFQEQQNLEASGQLDARTLTALGVGDQPSASSGGSAPSQNGSANGAKQSRPRQ